MDNIFRGDPWIYAKIEMEILKFAKFEIFQIFIYFSCETFNFRASIFLHFLVSKNKLHISRIIVFNFVSLFSID